MIDAPRTPARFRSEVHEALLTHAWLEPPPRHPSSRRLRLVIPGTVLAAAVIIAVLVLSLGGELAPQRASAASVLRASAAALEHPGVSRGLNRGEYLYTKLRIWWRYAGARRPYVVQSVAEEWAARDGSGRDRTRVLSVSGPGPRGVVGLTRSGDQRVAATARPFTLESGLTLSYDQLRALPSEPARLAATIDRLAARQMHAYSVLAKDFPRGQWQTVLRFGAVRGLAQAPASARVRAALYRVLASTPGIRLLGPRTDSVGRPGTAVGATLGAFDFTLIIDPASGALLQTSRTLLHRSDQDPGQPPGLVNRATFLASSIVRSTAGRTH
jgi:hypothetical protein